MLPLSLVSSPHPWIPLREGLTSTGELVSWVMAQGGPSLIQHVFPTVRYHNWSVPRKQSDGFLGMPAVNHQTAMEFMKMVKERSGLVLLADNPRAANLASYVQCTRCTGGGVSPPPTLRTAAFCAMPDSLVPPTLGQKAGLHGFMHDATAVDMLPAESGDDRPQRCELQPGMAYESGFLCPVYTPHNGTTGRMLRLSAVRPGPVYRRLMSYAWYLPLVER